jgi:CRISPR-associated protein Csx17
VTAVQLDGCRTQPLGSYLKALGLLRLVGEQVDRDATGRWDGEAFVLDSPLDADGLVRFLVDDYQPTPLVAPWNGRGGFRTEESRPSERLLSEFEHAVDDRLNVFQEAIFAGREVYQRARASSWDPKKHKHLWVEACRATFPDQAVVWIDSVVVLTGQKPVFPPILGGAGGVLGSMDLSSNFMDHLAVVLRLPFGRPKLTLESVQQLAVSALFEVGQPRLLTASSGQFNPGSALTGTSSPTGLASKLVNPWDYILLLEGALLFASSAARRLGSASAAMPFMVTSSAVGYPSAAAEEGEGEIWAPIWNRPATTQELARLLGEGRAAWKKTQAKTGIDFVRALASLGVDRGISHFVRHVVAERLGQSSLAVPVGRIEVRAKPEVPVLAALDPWVGRLRRARDVPAAVATALRRLDAAQFEVSVRGGPAWLQQVLVAAAELEVLVSRSPALRDKEVRHPLQGLRATEWLPLLDDGTPELRLAAAIASQSDRVTSPGPLTDFDRHSGSPALFLRAVLRDSPWAIEWSRRPPRVPGHGHRPVTEVLAQLLVRRAIDVAGRRAGPDEGGGQVGVQPAFHHGLRAPVADVAAFVEGRLDQARLDRLLAGMLLLDWRARADDFDTSGWRRRAGSLDRPVSAIWALVAPFFHGRPLHPGDGIARTLRPASRWPALLAAGRPAEVTHEALLRLRIAHLDPAPAKPAALAATIDQPASTRLAAALVCPLSNGGATELLCRTVPDPLDRTATTPPHRTDKEPTRA